MLNVLSFWNKIRKHYRENVWYSLSLVMHRCIQAGYRVRWFFYLVIFLISVIILFLVSVIRLIRITVGKSQYWKREMTVSFTGYSEWPPILPIIENFWRTLGKLEWFLDLRWQIVGSNDLHQIINIFILHNFC